MSWLWWSLEGRKRRATASRTLRLPRPSEGLLLSNESETALRADGMRGMANEKEPKLFCEVDPLRLSAMLLLLQQALPLLPSVCSVYPLSVVELATLSIPE